MNLGPYANFHELNIQWVLQVVNATENAIKNLPQTVADEVAKQLDETVQKVEAAITEIQGEMNALDASVKNRLSENEYAMAQLNASVELQLTTNLNKVNNLITNAEKDVQNQIADADKRVNDAINKITAEMAELSKLLNSDMDELKTFVLDKLQIYDKSIADLQENYTTKLSETLEEIKKLFEELYNSYMEVSKQLDAKIDDALLKAKMWDELIYMSIDSAVAELQQQIDNLKMGILPTQVINPVNAKVEDAQKTLNDMWWYLNAWGLTAQEYQTLNFSAAEYDNFQLSAYEYDYLGKWYLDIGLNIQKSIDTINNRLNAGGL